MKKAQSISINTIVVAIIALLVLIVLVFVFGKQMSDWFETTNTCETVGGICDCTKCDECPSSTSPKNYAQVPGATCPKPNEKNQCCRKIIPDIPTT